MGENYLSLPSDLIIDPINIDISAIIHMDNDKTDTSLNIILQKIKSYTYNIQTANFQGKGTINDYIENTANILKYSTVVFKGKISTFCN